ncbi:hypothetical protein SLEP1_g50583 [Rubroshorea leprosula]|uniref:non-specific serine/threonine protein kinase n=1 Tax=Rubroshorea leprosula TaxID=152421 RepID=A0AAV5M2K7_9ROSI|nr:hypothetical protein SLEP1_g50583 [Rubroshorea leprosula]
MDAYFFLHSIFITIFILLICTSIAYCNDDDDDYHQYLSCNSTYNCGILKDIGYPFWGNGRSQFCGYQGFELLCEEGQYSTADIGGQKFRVLDISRSAAAIMTIAPVGIWGQDACPVKFINISLSQSLFTLAPSAQNLSFFYGCPPQTDHIPVRNKFNCTINGSLQDAYFVDESLLRINPPNLTKCNISISLPVNQMAIEELLIGNEGVGITLNKGFDVQYTSVIINCSACQNSDGRCGSNFPSLEFLCFCPDQPYPRMCLKPGTHVYSFHINKMFLFIVFLCGS